MLIIGAGAAGAKLATQFCENEKLWIVGNPDAISWPEGVVADYAHGNEQPQELEAAFSYNGPTTEESVIIFLCSSSASFPVVFKILEFFKNFGNNDVRLILLKSEILPLLSTEEKDREEGVWSLLQAVFRSGVFKECILFDNSLIPLLDYEMGEIYDLYNAKILYALSTYLFLETQKPQMGNLNEVDKAGRLVALGILDVSTGEEKLLFDLKFPREKRYHFLVDMEDLKKRPKSHLELLDSLRFKKANNREKLVYGIHQAPTEAEVNSGVVVYRSSVIQSDNFIKNFQN